MQTFRKAFFLKKKKLYVSNLKARVVRKVFAIGPAEKDSREAYVQEPICTVVSVFGF